MQRVALVVKVPQGKRIDDLQALVNENVNPKILADADYLLTWEPGAGFTVLQHPLDVKGSKKGFISAPDVLDDDLHSRVRFVLDESTDLQIWMTGL